MHRPIHSLTPGALPPLAPGAAHVWRLPWDARRETRERAIVEALSRYLPVGMPARLVRADGGRPLLADAPSDLHFGVTHSGDLLLLAISRTDCGVDVERYGRRRRYREIAAQYFAPEALTGLADVDDAELERRFLRLWVAKEALLKANGIGIGAGLRQLWIDIDATPPVLRRAPISFGDPAGWCLTWFTPRDDALAAVATAGVCGELVLVDATNS